MLRAPALGNAAFDCLFRSIQQALPHLFAYLGQVHAILVLRAAESVGIVGSFTYPPRPQVPGENAQPQAETGGCVAKNVGCCRRLLSSVTPISSF